MKFKELVLLVFVTAIWGFNFSFIKLGLTNFDPYLLAALRFSLCVFPAILWIKRPRVGWRYFLAYGVMFGVVQWGMIYAGIRLGVTAGIASLLTQTSVLMSIFLGTIFFKERMTLPMLLGTTISFAGILLIFSQTQGSSTLWGLCCILVGAFAWSISNIIVKKSKATEIFGFLIWSSLFAPIPLILLSYSLSGSQSVAYAFEHFDRYALMSVLFQVYPTTLFGYSVWNHFMQKYPVSMVAPLSLLVPVFGIASSVLMFHEELPTYKWIAILLILSGLIVQRYANRLIETWTLISTAWSDRTAKHRL